MSPEPNVKTDDAITLERIVTELSTQFGWTEMGRRIPIRCFQFDPSVKSSLTFLRRTPWARAKVERIWLEMVADRAFKKMTGKPKAK